MFKEIFLLILLGHIIGEFYIINEKAIEKRKQKFRWLLFYGLIYFCILLLVSIPVMSTKVLLLIGIVSICHLLVDGIQCLCEKKHNSNTFIIIESVYITLLIMVSYVFAKRGMMLEEISWFKDFFDTVNVSERMLCKWILGLLIIHRPANQLIQNLIPNYKPENKDDNREKKNDKNIGRVIGTVERAIMLILIYMNQYAAIGLVLTAKSIARYDKITKEKDFAEYYLLGTLISLGVVIACGVLLFGIEA